VFSPIELAQRKHRALDVIITTLRMKTPALKTPEFVGALRLLLRRARAEKGFLDSQITADVDDPSAIYYEERWKSRVELEEQVRSSRYTQLLALMESASETPTLEFHFVSDTRGLDFIEAARGKERTC